MRPLRFMHPHPETARTANDGRAVCVPGSPDPAVYVGGPTEAIICVRDVDGIREGAVRKRVIRSSRVAVKIDSRRLGDGTIHITFTSGGCHCTICKERIRPLLIVRIILIKAEGEFLSTNSPAAVIIFIFPRIQDFRDISVSAASRR